MSSTSSPAAPAPNAHQSKVLSLRARDRPRPPVSSSESESETEGLDIVFVPPHKVSSGRKLRLPAARTGPRPVVPVLTRVDLPVPHGAQPAWYEYGVLPADLCMDTDLFHVLLNLHPEEYGKVKMFGKVMDTARYQANYGLRYFYTGMWHEAEPIPHPYLERLLQWVCEHSGKSYKQMIVNWYMDGSHYISAHSDSTKDLVPHSAIYSFSFGATRNFIIKNREDRGAYGPVNIKLALKENDVVIMGGSMQTYYKHEVPKVSHSGPRINVTCRLMK